MSYLNPHTHKLDGQTKTLADMATEVRANNIEKGWRTPEGLPTHTWPEGLFLIGTEISEAGEAVRSWGLKDATDVRCMERGCQWFGSSNCPDLHVRQNKPEGFGSELADVLIRWLDEVDAYGVGYEGDMELADVTSVERIPDWGDSPIARLHWLSKAVADVPVRADGMAPRDADRAIIYFPMTRLLRALVTLARAYDIDLMTEYERKMAYNATREFRHGGRSL